MRLEPGNQVLLCSSPMPSIRVSHRRLHLRQRYMHQRCSIRGRVLLCLGEAATHTYIRRLNPSGRAGRGRALPPGLTGAAAATSITTRIAAASVKPSPASRVRLNRIGWHRGASSLLVVFRGLSLGFHHADCLCDCAVHSLGVWLRSLHVREQHVLYQESPTRRLVCQHPPSTDRRPADDSRHGQL